MLIYNVSCNLLLFSWKEDMKGFSLTLPSATVKLEHFTKAYVWWKTKKGKPLQWSHCQEMLNVCVAYGEHSVPPLSLCVLLYRSKLLLSSLALCLSIFRYTWYTARWRQQCTCGQGESVWQGAREWETVTGLLHMLTFIRHWTETFQSIHFIDICYNTNTQQQTATL